MVAKVNITLLPQGQLATFVFIFKIFAKIMLDRLAIW